MKKNYLVMMIVGLLVVLGLSVALTSSADASSAKRHNAVGGADCVSFHLDADSYDGSKLNKYMYTVGGDTKSGTFGDSIHVSVPIPQDGATTSWSYDVQAFDGSYHFADSGTVGPCGTPPPTCTDTPSLCPPPPVVKHPKAWFHLTPYCNTVRVEGRHNVSHISVKRDGGKFVFRASSVKGALFSNGKNHQFKHAHVKRTGCHSSGS